MANDWSSGMSLIYLAYIPTLIYECDGQCSDRVTCHWFKNSRYLCHCEGGVACDTTSGYCPGGRCDIKWFGPACQYASVSYKNTFESQRHIWLMDGNDTTCNNRSESAVQLSLDTAQPLTWIRVVVSRKEAIGILQFQTLCKMPSGATTLCQIIDSAKVDGNTLDLHCPSSQVVKYLILSGLGVANLCSIYISGGRNLALKQTNLDELVSRQGRKTPWKAVDGKIPHISSPTSIFESLCTNTKMGTGRQQAYWTLTFSRLVKVVRFDVYNRFDFCCRDRLRWFTFKAFDKDNNNIFQWTDANNTAQEIYKIVPSPRLSKTVERILLTVPTESLSMCEVVVYGESECPEGRYGLECEHTCNCARQEPCFVSTGGCPSGCSVGYTGEDCQTQCNNGAYGKNCPSICSLRCVNATCSKIYGHCTMGCKEGWTGDYCDIKDECKEDGTYGINCSSICSSHCANSTCDKIDGHCTMGCKEGWTGDFCDTKTECEDGTYGINCLSICSSNCANSTCNKTDGHCTMGCKEGSTGGYCDIKAAKYEEKGEDYSDTVVLVTFLFLILLLVLTLFMQKAPKKGKNNAEEDDNIDAHKSDGGYEKDEDADVSHDKDKLFYDEDNMLADDGNLELALTLDKVEEADH